MAAGYVGGFIDFVGYPVGAGAPPLGGGFKGAGRKRAYLAEAMQLIMDAEKTRATQRQQLRELALEGVKQEFQQRMEIARRQFQLTQNSIWSVLLSEV